MLPFHYVDWRVLECAIFLFSFNGASEPSELKRIQKKMVTFSLDLIILKILEDNRKAATAYYHIFKENMVLGYSRMLFISICIV